MVQLTHCFFIQCISGLLLCCLIFFISFLKYGIFFFYIFEVIYKIFIVDLWCMDLIFEGQPCGIFQMFSSHGDNTELYCNLSRGIQLSLVHKIFVIAGVLLNFCLSHGYLFALCHW